MLINKSIHQRADYFHITKPTVVRWLDGTMPVNPMTEKLLLIKSLGYLPNDIRWSGFRVFPTVSYLVVYQN